LSADKSFTGKNLSGFCCASSTSSFEDSGFRAPAKTMEFGLERASLLMESPTVHVSQSEQSTAKYEIHSPIPLLDPEIK
jgi:hypothetical protein